MSQNPNIFAPRIGQKAYRLQRMENYLSLALEASGDERAQRKYMQLLINEAAAIKEPVADWLAQLFKSQQFTEAPPVPVLEQSAAVVEGFVCDTCNRSFKTKHALCGHQRTHAKP